MEWTTKEQVIYNMIKTGLTALYNWDWLSGENYNMILDTIQKEIDTKNIKK